MKDKYEISLWDDVLIPEQVVDGDTIREHFEEQKIAVIGSDDMTSDCRAINCKLVENINGTHTFSFVMYYKYTDPITREKYDNPFTQLLINERKVKVYWKDEWYDFIIKTIQEDSSGKSVEYTCTDLYINELSKTGFELEYNEELNNNSGTILELAADVLSGTDWQLDEEESDLIQQTNDESTYGVKVKANFTATNESDGGTKTFVQDDTLLVFYNQIADLLDLTDTTGSINLQFAWAENYACDANSELVNNSKCFVVNNVTWIKTTHENVDCIEIKSGNTTYFYIYYSSGVRTEINGIYHYYKAPRLIKKPVEVYDSLTDNYARLYVATQDITGTNITIGDEIYEYEYTNTNSALTVTNLVVNNRAFISTEGWAGENLVFQLYPTLASIDPTQEYNGKGYLRLTASNYYYNSGLREMRNYIKGGFSVGEKYIFRYKAQTDSNGNPSGTYLTTSNPISPRICEYTISGSTYTPIDDSDYFSVSEYAVAGTNNWIERELTCTKSASLADIYNKPIGLFSNPSVTCWIEEIQLFKKIEYVDNGTTKRINPGEINSDTVTEVKYFAYNHTKTTSLDIEEIVPIHDGTSRVVLPGLEMQYNEDFVKIRSIEAKQSNRFNILQTLAETFECWMRFHINHDGATGKILYDLIEVDDDEYVKVPQKYVTIKKDIGEDTGLSFIYGIDLKTIKRTIQSDQIVTKTIVAANSNQYADNGSCEIAQANDNYCKENFILNFDYYATRGLLNKDQLNKDLYLSTGLGYYYNLHTYNTQYYANATILNGYYDNLNIYEGYKTLFESTITAYIEQIDSKKSYIMGIASANTWTAALTYIKTHGTTEEIKSAMQTLTQLEVSLANYQTQLTDTVTAIDALMDKIEVMETAQSGIQNSMAELHKEFYQRYSRYIQEGSWINEDYVDANLYYYDALQVAYTSSRPQISYDISVLRLSALDEFKYKIFKLGDIAYIEDTEFFGYADTITLPLTPYKEQVLVSEITSYFDQPDQDTFKIQNYKTQFEDLFQRITSATQTLQYTSGQYAKASSVIESDGTISLETLQASFARNEDFVYASTNDLVVTDSTGMTVSDGSNPNYKTKITSGGLFITRDGGATWKNAIRGEGIATEYLTSGLINTNTINIMDGTSPQFRWDTTGLNAYDKVTVGDHQFISLSKFVRFDRFGIYGYDGGSTEFAPSSAAEIKSNAYVKFGLLWDGLFIKHIDGSYTVNISNTDDINITQGNTERLKIGKLGNDNYGLRISDSNGVVLETTSNGSLWLKDKLHISDSASGAYNIAIGKLPGVKALGSSIHEVFNANNAFFVYEDGSINATSGKIGSMSISEIGHLKRAVTIVASPGTIFKPTSDTPNPQITLTARLYEGAQEITSGLSYQWYKGSTAYATTQAITLTYNEATTPEVQEYSCTITTSD